MGVQEGAAATVNRALLSRNREIGVFTDGDGTSLTLRDVVIWDTQARESDGTGGRERATPLMRRGEVK